MIFLLGVLTAGLLALLFLTAFWRRAMRLSARRLELQMPLSMNEIVAERDQLRAEFAAERRKLEQKSEKLAFELAQERAALGKQSTRGLELEAKLGEVAADGRAAHALAERYERLLNESEGERVAGEKALYDVEGMLGRRTQELAQLKEEHAALTVLSDERRVAIAGLETRVSGLEMDLSGARQEVERLGKTLDEKTSLAQFLERERDQFHSDAVAARRRRDALQERVNGQQTRIEKLEEDLRGLRRDHAKLQGDLEHRQRDLQEAEAQLERLRIELREKENADGQRHAALAGEIEAQVSAQAALRGALEAARRDNQSLRAEVTRLRNTASDRAVARDNGNGTSQARPDKAQLELRQAIVELGSDLIRLTDELERGEAITGRDLAAKVDALCERVRIGESISG